MAKQTRRERLQEKEQLIIEAAQEEFLKHGFDGAKVAHIARRADIAEGTIYLYFKNKNALLLAVVASFYERLTAGASAGVADRDATHARLEFLVHHHLECCIKEWGIIEQVAAAYRLIGDYRGSRYIEFNRTYVAIFDAVIKEGVSRGDIRRDISLQVMRDLFYGALEYSARTHMIRESTSGSARKIADLSRQIMALVGPALGLKDPQDRTAETGDLRELTRRLENVVDHLETSLVSLPSG